MINKFVYLALMKFGKVTNNCVCLVFNYEQYISSVLRVTLYEHALRQLLGSWNKAPKIKMFRIKLNLIVKLFHLRLLETRLVIANSYPARDILHELFAFW